MTLTADRSRNLQETPEKQALSLWNFFHQQELVLRPFRTMVACWQEQGSRCMPGGIRHRWKGHPHTSAHSISALLVLLFATSNLCDNVSDMFSSAVQLCVQLSILVVSTVARLGASGCDVVRTIDGRVIRELELHRRGAAFQYTQTSQQSSGSVSKLRFDVERWADTLVPSCRRLCTAFSGTSLVTWQPSCQPSACPSPA